MKTTHLFFAIAFALLPALAAADDEDESVSRTPGLVQKVGGALERGADAAAHGIETGVNATVNGVERGFNAVGNGFQRGMRATTNTIDNVSAKLFGSPKPAPQK
jgi:hypothetical protein